MKKFILFDFDGVIADSFSAAYRTAQKYCAVRTEDMYRKQFEGNIYDAVLDITTGDHSKCEHDLDWWEMFVPLFEKEAKPFDGMLDAIQIIAKKYQLIIVSSSIESPIQGFMEKHGIESHFEAVMDHTVHKKKTEKIRMVFEKYRITAHDCVFITDTLGDVREAHESGTGCIAVDWGFHARETLEKGTPWRIIDAPSELPRAVDEYFGGLT